MTHHPTSPTTHLPYGIDITVTGQRASLSSELRAQLVDPSPARDDPALAMVHAIEALLLALAAEGVDLSGPGASRAVVTAVESVAEYLCSI